MRNRVLQNYCGEPFAALRSAHSLAYPFGMSRSLRSARLALEAAAATRYWRSQPIAGATAKPPLPHRRAPPHRVRVAIYAR